METKLYDGADKIAKALQIRINLDGYKSLVEWDDKEFSNFIKNSNLISVNTIQTYIYNLKKLYKYNCELSGVKPKSLKLLKSIEDYIDLQRLRSKTVLHWEEMIGLRNELVKEYNGREVNHRDAVILWLPWFSLTSIEIRNLLEKNVEEIWENSKITKVKLHLEDRVVVIEEPVVVKDILACKNERAYLRFKEYEDKGEVVDEVPYVSSPYLIKGIANYITKPNTPIRHPGMLLQKQLSKIHFDTPLDFEHLSLEDIRRSMLIHTLNNNKDVKIATLKCSLNKKQQTDLVWLKNIAKILKELDEKERIGRRLAQ